MENLKFSKGDRYDIPLQLSFFATLSGTLQQQGYFSEHDSLGFAVLFKLMSWQYADKLLIAGLGSLGIYYLMKVFKK